MERRLQRLSQRNSRKNIQWNLTRKGNRIQIKGFYRVNNHKKDRVLEMLRISSNLDHGTKRYSYMVILEKMLKENEQNKIIMWMIKKLDKVEKLSGLKKVNK